MSVTGALSTDSRLSFSPYRLPLFGATESELEQFMLFALFAVRTNADVANSSLRKLLDGMNSTETPYQFLREVLADNLEDGKNYEQRRQALMEDILRESGCRFYKMKAKGVLYQLYEVGGGAQLRDVSRYDMLKWPGVGWKTSSFFVLHTQIDPPDPVACLDVHILRWLKRKVGRKMAVPDIPPSRAEDYYPLEFEFLRQADRAGVHPAYFDVGIWVEERLKK
jgi:thermostable 8-oxoguanine DNA glycosylase